MNVSRLFSIVFNSSCLWIFYLFRLKKNRPDTGALPLLMRKLVHGPRLINTGNVQHYKGYCYYVTFSEQIVTGMAGHSSLIIFENGVELSSPNTLDLNKIISLGEGRSIQIEDKLFFSASDNASAEIVLKRNYQLFDSLTMNASSLKLLLRLADNVAMKKNLVHYIFRSILLYLPGKISFSGIAGSSEKSMDFFKVCVDLNQWYLSIWSAEKISISYFQCANVTQCTINISQLSIDAISAEFEIQLVLEINDQYEVIPISIRLINGKALLVDFNLTCERNDVKQIVFHTDALLGFRTLLMESFGSDEMAYRQWLSSTFSRFANNFDNFPVKITDETCQTIIQYLSPRSWVNSITIQLMKRSGVFNVSISESHIKETVL